MRSHPAVEVWEGRRFVAWVDAPSRSAAD
jgi:hypothetical protein